MEGGPGWGESISTDSVHGALIHPVQRSVVQNGSGETQMSLEDTYSGLRMIQITHK